MWTFLLALILSQSGFSPAHREKALVLLFVRSDCPISNRYAPELQRLYNVYSPKGIGFRLVYTEQGLTPAAMEKHRQEYGYSIPGMLDPEHRQVNLAGVGTTPEAAVFIGNRLVYRGRIDDRYVAIGRERPSALHHDLEEVLVAIEAGKPVSFRETMAVGCAIEKLK